MTQLPSEPFWEDFDPSETGPLPGRVGPFRIEAELGRGTFAIVYSAFEEHPARRVAVKVLRPGLDRGEALRRFRREATVLARCQHPGIAQVYEGGEENLGAGSQHYLAMELVEGLPITHHARELGLDERQKAALLLELLEAVACAHEAGIVHRDLKPANVLVTRDGQPKVIDFGVARLTRAGEERTSRTADGQLLGTIPYMSPEQVMGVADEIDARSDVYSIGVLGFELFTERLPYEASGLSLVSAITEREPLRAGSVDPRLAGDVEAILSKALEKDPDERYPSARAMAADLRRYLRYEPISVRAPSLGYQLRKLARRNPLFVGSVAAAFVILVLGFAGTTYGLLTTAATKRDLAANLAAMRGFALDELRTFHDEIRPRIASTEAQTRMLENLEPQVTGLLARAPDDVGLLTARARILEARATRALEDERRAEGLELLSEGRRAALRACELAPDDVDALRALSLVEVRQGDVAKDDQDLGRAFALYLGVLDRDERAVRAHPDHPRLVDDVCWGYGRMGALLAAMGEHERAGEYFERFHRTATELARWDPEPLRARLALCGSYSGLIQQSLLGGDLERALQLAEEQIGVARGLVEASPHDVVYRGYYAGAMSAAAAALGSLGRDQAARDQLVALVTERHFLAEYHGGEHVLAYVSAAAVLIGWYQQAGLHEQAARLARELAEEGGRLAALAGSPRIELLVTARTCACLARCLDETPEGDEARDHARRAYEDLRQRGLAGARDLEDYAQFALADLGRPDLARSLLEGTEHLSVSGRGLLEQSRRALDELTRSEQP